MNETLEEVMRRYVAVMETATGRKAGEQQIRTALTLCDTAAGKRVVAEAPEQEDALLVAGLAAAALAERGGEGTVHLATRDAEDAEKLTQAFQDAGLTARVNVAPAETLVFEYLKAGGTGATVAPVAIVSDADQTLVRDANTPLILAGVSGGASEAVSPKVQKEADRTLQNGRDYVVQEGAILIRDPETGDLFPGRRFSSGLQAAVEARERLTLTGDGEPIAQIRMGDYFRRYPALVAVSTTMIDQCATLYGMEVR